MNMQDKLTFYQIRDKMILLMEERRNEGQKKMPSENELADYFNVSRPMIRSVYQQLVELGYLFVEQGKGYYIQTNLPTVNLVLRGDQSFTQKMLDQGYDFYSQQLPIEEDSTYFYFSRLRLIQGIPMALHRSRLAKDDFPNFKTEIADGTSLFSYLRAKGYQEFQSSRTKLSIEIPNQVMSQILQCPALTSLLVLKSNCIDGQTGRELERSTIYYRSDIVNFSV